MKLLILILLVAPWITPAHAQDEEPDYRGAVVLIERPREGGLPPEIGTGFFISPDGHILTAAHVLLESNEGDDVVRRRPLNVRLFGSPLARAARILELNRLTDVALLKVKTDTETPFLPLGDSRTVKSGDVLTLIGHPLGRQEWNVSAGLVDSVTTLERIFMQATLVKGQSGGPGINEDGEVVGIASYREEGAQQSYLVPINDTVTLLGGWATGSSPTSAAVAVGGAALGAVVVTPTTNTSIVDAEVERNDFVGDANRASVGATIRGRLSVEDEDWSDFFHFNVPQKARGKMRLIVRENGSSFNTGVSAVVYDENEEKLDDGSAGSGDSWSVELPERNSYIIKMSPSGGFNLPPDWWVNYGLTLKAAQ